MARALETGWQNQGLTVGGRDLPTCVLEMRRAELARPTFSSSGKPSLRQALPPPQPWLELSRGDSSSPQ